MEKDSLLNRMSKIAAKTLLEYDSPIWSVYVIVNESRKEVYFGVSKDPDHRILSSHAQHKTKAIEHWEFQKEIVEAEIMHSGINKYKASSIAHEYEKRLIPGYLVIRTSGT